MGTRWEYDLLSLTELGVEVFIKKSQLKNSDVFWDNYSLIVWKKNNLGYTNPNGSFRKNQWGIVEKFAVQDDGVWKLPVKYVKHFK